MDKETLKSLPFIIGILLFLLFAVISEGRASERLNDAGGGPGSTASVPVFDKLILGTATPGGGFPIYGEALAKAISMVDPAITVKCRTTKGSTENIPLLMSGDLDIALIQGEVARDILSDRDPKAQGLRIISVMYATPGMFGVRRDSGYKTIQDLAGKRVIFGARGSGLIVLSRYVLDAVGLDQDKDFDAIYLEKVADALPMILDGRAVALWGGGIGWPGFEKLSRDPGGVRFITPNESEISKITTRYPFLKKLTIPAGSYVGQPFPLTSVGSWSFILARASLPDDTAYRIAQAIHKAEGLLGTLLPQAGQTTLTNTLSAVSEQDLIHPGVLTYMKEAGLLK